MRLHKWKLKLPCPLMADRWSASQCGLGKNMRLLSPASLHTSSVVANCAMNRERRLTGSNSYRRDLGFEVLAFLTRAPHDSPTAWVDLCCGMGRALVEAASELQRMPYASSIRIEGIDLAGHFDPNPFPEILTFTEQAIESWTPSGPYRLVTCVHGFHYIGDKLGALAKAARCLMPTGRLVANLDLDNFRFADGRLAGRTVVTRLRRHGFSYDARRKLVGCEGPQVADFGLSYLGADDTAGSNYTGQSAVDSYYAA